MNKYRKKNLAIAPEVSLEPETKPKPKKKPAAWVKFVLPVLYATAIFLPIITFFNLRGGLGTFEGLEAKDYFTVLFPLFGLVAFTLVAWQVLIATNLWWLQKYWPKIVHYHRLQGMTALVFAGLHPLFILIGYGASTYFGFDYVSPARVKYLIFGYLALSFMFATVITALLAWHGMKLPFWRWVHRLNYAVFFLIWYHSWSLGTDTQAGNLKNLWLIYLLVVTFSVGLNWWYRAYRAPIVIDKPNLKH